MLLEENSSAVMQERMMEYQARIEEFRALREEQLYALRSRVWGLATYAAISAGLFTFAKDVAKPTACLAVIFLAIPIIYYTVYVVRMSVRISAYIMVVLEPNLPGLQWQHNLEAWRREVAKQNWERFFGRWPYVFSILGVYDIVAACSFYIILIAHTHFTQILLALIGIAFITYCHFYLNKILTSQNHYARIFQSLQPPDSSDYQP